MELNTGSDGSDADDVEQVGAQTILANFQFPSKATWELS